MSRALILGQAAALAMLMLWASSGQAWAEEGASERMLKLNEEGFSAFEDEDFVRAAKKFEQAHALVPDSILRKNAAIAWFKAEKCPEASGAAIFFLLAEDTQRQDRLEARSVLAHCYLDEAERALSAGDGARAETIVAWAEVLEVDSKVGERVSAIKMRAADIQGGDAGASAARARAGWVLVGTGVALIASAAAYHIVSDDPAPGGQGWALPVLYGAGALSAGGGAWLVYSANSRGGAHIKDAERAGLGAPGVELSLNWAFRF